MEKPRPAVRTVEPCRTQVEMKFASIDELVDEAHLARVVDAVVGQLDLKVLLTKWRARQGHAGRAVTSVRMLLTLWIYALARGVGSAREIERRTRTEDAFKWIVGDMLPSHDVIARFRVEQGDGFDALLTDILATLIHRGLLDLNTVAQDGTRLRASASAASFRSEEALLQCREQAALHLKAVLATADENTPASQAAREAGARDFQRRVDEALATFALLRETTDAAEKARASTTDPEARVMKMADGGFRPGYNAQFSVAGDADGGPRTIVAVQVTNRGSDLGSITPALEQMQCRTGKLPKKLLADANHTKLDCITKAKKKGVRVYCPTMKRGKKGATAPAVPRGGDTPEVAEWRVRMNSCLDRRVYGARASLSELANAFLKGRSGLASVSVRGTKKVTSSMLLFAVASNILQHAHHLV
jgi:transposase